MKKTKRNARRRAKPLWTLRQWTQDNLMIEDYAFALSTNPAQWRHGDIIADQWDEGLRRRCFDWEMDREFECCDFLPFTVAFANLIQSHRGLSPAEIPPLTEILDYQAAIRALTEQPGFPMRTVHVFEIEDHANTETLVQRFQNWLTSKRTSWPTHCGMVLTDSGFPKERVMPKQQGWVFNLTNGGELRVRQGDPGRKKDTRKLLRALVLRRLSLAGYSRTEAADLLCQGQRPAEEKNTNDNRISHTEWSRFPEQAQSEVDCAAARFRRSKEIAAQLATVCPDA